MYSKYIMSNPFIKNPTLNSSERTERLASYSKVATLRKNKAITSNYIDDFITMKNNVVTQAVDHKTLLSTNGVSNDVSFINVEKLKVEKSIKVGRFPWGVVISPN